MPSIITWDGNLVSNAALQFWMSRPPKKQMKTLENNHA